MVEQVQLDFVMRCNIRLYKGVIEYQFGPPH